MLKTTTSGFHYEKPICELLNVLPAVICDSMVTSNEDFTQLNDFTW